MMMLVFERHDGFEIRTSLKDDRRKFRPFSPWATTMNRLMSQCALRFQPRVIPRVCDHSSHCWKRHAEFVTLRHGEQVLIGRDGICEAPPARSSRFEKRHAIINSDKDGTLTIIDLGSTNGSFENGQQIDPLPQIGDHIDIGDVHQSTQSSQRKSVTRAHPQRLEAANQGSAHRSSDRIPGESQSCFRM